MERLTIARRSAAAGPPDDDEPATRSSRPPGQVAQCVVEGIPVASDPGGEDQSTGEGVEDGATCQPPRPGPRSPSPSLRARVAGGGRAWPTESGPGGRQARGRARAGRRGARRWKAAARRRAERPWSSSGHEAEGVVVVVRVVDVPFVADHEPAGTAIRRSGCLDGVLRVVADRLVGQDALAVLERAAILVVRERPAVGDEPEGLLGLGRQFLRGDRATLPGRRRLRLRSAARWLAPRRPSTSRRPAGARRLPAAPPRSMRWRPPQSVEPVSPREGSATGLRRVPAIHDAGGSAPRRRHLQVHVLMW